ncbi:hypothetical protein BASA81_007597 [Batrachochytrium salamandrivorans]|nr:hypothetical protein BASA81_007597 [Batrachochytrium salamandrivorans]
MSGGYGGWRADMILSQQQQMDQEEEELPLLQAQGVNRAQFLQGQIDFFGREIVRLARKIEAKGDLISSLIGVGKDTEHAAHVA